MARLPILFGAALLAVGALTAFAGAWHRFGHLILRGPSPVVGARTIDVTLGEFSFSPQIISVRTGEPVNLRLVNQGEALHDFTVPTQGIHRAAKPKEAITIGLRTDRPGEYEFYCSVTGHRELGMVGRIVVHP